MRAAAIILSALLLAGCASTPLTPAQLDALQQRRVGADRDQAFHAASNALLDAGFTIEVSDLGLGVLAADRFEEKPAALQAVVFIISTVGGAPLLLAPTLHTVCVHVVETEAPNDALVRIQSYADGLPVLESPVLDQLWTLMERQVLLHSDSLSVR